MRRLIGFAALMLVPAMILCSAGPASAQKKKDGDKDADSEVKNSEKMIKAGVVVGTISNLYQDTRKINLSVQVPQLNPQAFTSIAQAQQQMAQARAQGNWQGVIQAQQSLAQAQRTMYTMQTKNIELEARDDVIVRSAKPKEVYDDKGKIKRLTKAELKEQKGDDPKLPGYKAEYGDLSSSQVIQVTLVRKKNVPAPKVAAPKRKKGKDSDGEMSGPADLLGDNLPQISQILILGEAKSGG